MRFVNRVNTSNSSSDSADIAVTSIRIEISADVDPIIRAHYWLRARDPSDKRKLLIDFSSCPLIPMEISSTVADSFRFPKSRSQNVVQIALQSGGTKSWDESELTIVLRWSKFGSHPSLVDRAFLYTPEELPAVGARAGTEILVTQPLPITVEDEKDQFLIGSISSDLNRPFERGGAQVQAVLSTKPAFYSARISHEQEICLLSEDDAVQTDEIVGSVSAQLAQLIAYFGNHLGAHPAIRVSADLDSSADSRAMSGALLTAPSSWYSMPGPKRLGRPFQIARMIADIWWGTGCTVSGKRGTHLGSGLAFALALEWARSHTPTDYFSLQIQYFRERLVRDYSPNWTQPSPGERTVPIAIAIFDGLLVSSSVLDAIKHLTGTYWGREAPEGTCLEVCV